MVMILRSERKDGLFEPLLIPDKLLPLLSFDQVLVFIDLMLGNDVAKLTPVFDPLSRDISLFKLLLNLHLINLDFSRKDGLHGFAAKLTPASLSHRLSADH